MTCPAMSSRQLSRRRFLTLPLILTLEPVAAALARSESGRLRYECDVGVLYNALRYRMTGTVDERIDRAGGRYEVRIEGQGTGFDNRAEASGVFRDGRWVPLRGRSWAKIAGREGRAEISYDPDRRVAHYRSRSETFFRGRLRVVDDVVAFPVGAHVDDMVSAILNHADGYWLPQAGGVLETRMVRRRRAPREGSEETSGEYRAEIVPVVLKLVPGSGDGKQTALFDMTGFSAWALPDRPARIVFEVDGRPEVVTARLMYGSTVTIRFGAG
ncbi:MAG: hypothetical protein ACREKS_06855 [Candidatus Rokuibacteriota bacterium]